MNTAADAQTTDFDPKSLPTSHPLYGDQRLLASIQDLDLSVRADNCLNSDEIMFVHELLQRNEAELQRIPNLGHISLNEIREKVHTFLDHTGKQTLLGSLSAEKVKEYQQMDLAATAAGIKDGIHVCLGRDYTLITGTRESVQTALNGLSGTFGACASKLVLNCILDDKDLSLSAEEPGDLNNTYPIPVHFHNNILTALRPEFLRKVTASRDFHDAVRGIVREHFVSGIDQRIDAMQQLKASLGG